MAYPIPDPDERDKEGSTVNELACSQISRHHIAGTQVIVDTVRGAVQTIEESPK